MIRRLFSFLLSITGLTIQHDLFAQSKNEYTQIIAKFEQWKLQQFKSGRFLDGQNCNPDTVTKHGYKGSELGIPKDIDISFTDINLDNKIDGLVTFRPDQCDGGIAFINTQLRVLILSSKSDYFIDDSYIDKIESQLKKGWLIIEKASPGTFSGTYFSYKQHDGRFTPSIIRPFLIDYKTKKLTFSDAK